MDSQFRKWIHIDVIYTDLEKAFNKVSHTNLINKLK